MNKFAIITMAIAVLAAIMALPAASFATPLGIVWDGSGDPTTLDSNGDLILDWVVRGGGAFTGTTDGGIYTGGQFLDTRPLSDFDFAFDVNMRWRNDGGTGTFDSLFWVNVNPDGAGPAYAAVFFSLINDGTSQTLNVYHKPSNVETLLASYGNLGLGFLDTKFAFDGAGNLAVTIDGTTHSSLVYSTTTTLNSDAFATIYGGVGKLQLDCIGIGVDCSGSVVPEPAGLGLLGIALLGLRKRRS